MIKEWVKKENLRRKERRRGGEKVDRADYWHYFIMEAE